MAVEPRLRRGLTGAAEHLSMPPATAGEVIGRARRRRTRHLAGYSLAAVVAVVAATFGVSQLAGVHSPGLDVAAGPGGPQRVVVFLCDGSTCDAITAAQREELHARLASDPATVRLTYESKQDAYRRFTERFADQPDLLEGVGADDLPASFRVLVAADVDAETFAARYESHAGVESAVVQDDSPPADEPTGTGRPGAAHPRRSRCAVGELSVLRARGVCFILCADGRDATEGPTCGVLGVWA